MSTGLITLTQNTGLSADEEKFFKSMTAGGGFLPRLQLFTGASGVCKSGQFPMNHWGLVRQKDTNEDLGAAVELIPLAQRFKALDCRGDILSYYDFRTPQFKEVAELSKDSNSKCMAGVEFLIWLSDQSEFCTYFAYNVSSRQEASKLDAMMNKAVTFTSRYVPNKKEPKKSFQAPVFNLSSIAPSSLPTQEDADEQWTKFKNAKDSVAQTASATDTAAMQRDQ